MEELGGKNGNVVPDRLLVLVQARPELYDIVSKDYYNTEKLNKLWEEIGQELNATAAECRAKWHSMRSSYARYLRDLKSGSGVKRKKWYLADAMAFLNKHTGHPKKTSSNLGSLSQAEPENYEQNLTSESGNYIQVNEESLGNVILWNGGDDVNKEEANPRKKQRKNTASDVQTVLQNSKEPEEDPMVHFFKGVLPDVHKLDDRRRRKLKLGILTLIDDLIDEQECSSGAPSWPPSFHQHFIDPPSVQSNSGHSND